MLSKLSPSCWGLINVYFFCILDDEPPLFIIDLFLMIKHKSVCALWCFLSQLCFFLMTFFLFFYSAICRRASAFSSRYRVQRGSRQSKIISSCCLCFAPGLNRICISLFIQSNASFPFFLLSYLFRLTYVQMDGSPSPKRQRLSQQSMLDLGSAPPSTPSSPIRPWELPPSRRPHPHYMPERCHTPVRNRRRYVCDTISLQVSSDDL